MDVKAGFEISPIIFRPFDTITEIFGEIGLESRPPVPSPGEA
jgi:hypothetical protein